MSKPALLNPTDTEAAAVNEMMAAVQRHIDHLQNTILRTELDHDAYLRTYAALDRLRRVADDMTEIKKRRFN